MVCRKGAADLAPRLDWSQRIEAVANSFIPRLIQIAPALKQEVEFSLNSPKIIRETWETIKALLQQIAVPQAIEPLLKTLDLELGLETRLLSVITGETVSNLMADFLCERIPTLQKNNRSTYPDLYFDFLDYRSLPQRQRGYALGPALKGQAPSSVPDGIEIKSQRGKRIRVDCHHDHQGLHLVMTFEQVRTIWIVNDIYLAYLAKADYRRATRNTTATTEKFSFSHTPFISIISGISKNSQAR